MTDNDIIKSLECCGNQMFSCTDKRCKALTLGNALDLILRQKAEIERFSRAIHNMSITTEVQMRAENEFQWLQINRVKQARDKAITEFAERLKNYYNKLDKSQGVLISFHIDQIAKELQEGINNA